MLADTLFSISSSQHFLTVHQASVSCSDQAESTWLGDLVAQVSPSWPKRPNNLGQMQSKPSSSAIFCEPISSTIPQTQFTCQNLATSVLYNLQAKLHLLPLVTSRPLLANRLEAFSLNPQRLGAIVLPSRRELSSASTSTCKSDWTILPTLRAAIAGRVGTGTLTMTKTCASILQMQT